MLTVKPWYSKPQSQSFTLLEGEPPHIKCFLRDFQEATWGYLDTWSPACQRFIPAWRLLGLGLQDMGKKAPELKKLRFVLALLRAAIQGGDRPLMLRLLPFIRHAQPQRNGSGIPGCEVGLGQSFSLLAATLVSWARLIVTYCNHACSPDSSKSTLRTKNLWKTTWEDMYTMNQY